MKYLRRFSIVALVAVLASTGCDCGDPAGSGAGGGVGGGSGGGGGGGSGGGAGGGGGNQPDAGPPPDVHVVITSDNAYGFGYGSSSALRVYFNGLEAPGSQDIFMCSEACDPAGPNTCDEGECDAFGSCNEDGLGPETYIVPGSDTNQGDFVYVVAWSDDYVTQGLLGQFAAADGSNVLYTGDDAWEVCSTGVDYDIGSGGPTVDVINQWIAECNQGAAGDSFSDGWLGTAGRGDMDLVVGEPNEPGGDGAFPDSCTDPDNGDSISSNAHWMWFDDDVTADPDAFHSSGASPNTAVNPHEFFIFRLGVDEIIIVPL